MKEGMPNSEARKRFEGMEQPHVSPLPKRFTPHTEGFPMAFQTPEQLREEIKAKQVGKPMEQKFVLPNE